MSDLDANFDNQLAAFMGGEKVEEVKEPETVETVSQEETITEPVKPAEPTTADKAKALGWNPDKDEFEAKTGKEWSTAGQYPVSYTHLTLPTTLHECRSRWSPYH